MAKVANLVYGEKYGDVNNPKTSWSTVGSIMTRTSNGEEPDQGDVEALQRLIDGGFIGVRIQTVPTSRNFDGWLSVFKPRDYEQIPKQNDVVDIESLGTPIDDVDLKEIPF